MLRTGTLITVPDRRVLRTGTLEAINRRSRLPRERFEAPAAWPSSDSTA